MQDDQQNGVTENYSKDPEKAAKLLKSVSEIVHVLNQKRTKFDRRLANILRIILDYLGVEQGSIMVLDRKKLVVKAATRHDIIGLKQSLTEGSVAAWVANHKTAIFIPDISQDSRFNKRGGQAYRKNALLSAPIMQGSKLMGVINATDKSGDRDLLREDITYLLEFSSFIISSLVQQQLQDKLRRQKNTLRQSNKELHRQEELREELSRMLIHDLKAPLSEVVANLDILSYSVTGENLEFLEAAQMSCDRTVRMVSNLVNINKIEDGKMQLFQEEVEVTSLLEESYSAIKGLAQIKGVKLTMEMSKEALPTMHLDRILTLRVLQNLLINALGHTPANTEILLGCKIAKDLNFLEFFIQDQGPGISPENQLKIFNKYSRVSDQDQNIAGTGLGLYFCKLAVEMQKGTIGISSISHKGSRFNFTLPI